MTGHVAGHVTGQTRFGHVTFPRSRASEVPESRFVTAEEVVEEVAEEVAEEEEDNPLQEEEVDKQIPHSTKPQTLWKPSGDIHRR